MKLEFGKVFNMKLKSNAGFSLIEVMVALAITGFITAAIFETFKTQHKHYMVQDDITTIQQNARASIDELTRQIRQAGYGVPSQFPCIVAANTNPDTITLIYQVKNCDTYLTAPMPQPSAELKCDGDLTCWEEGQEAFIYEPDSQVGEFFVITQVQNASSHLQHNTTNFSRKYGANSIVLSLTAAKFFVDKTTDVAHPKLMVKYGSKPAAIYADDVTDLQFRYRMKNNATLDVPTIASDVREVLISVTGRSNRKDPDESGEDVYRLRTFASSASMRNLGL
jgi:prepilin-type N-terminal cleavage/methylation domain-containing protein